MGQAPSQPTDAQTAELDANTDHALSEAAAALFDADVLLLLVGDSLCATTLCATCGIFSQPQPPNVHAVSGLTVGGANERSSLNPHSEPEAFYGFYGDEFNRSRETLPNAAYGIVQQWVDRRFTGTATDVAMQTAMKDALRSPPPRPDVTPAPAPARDAGAALEDKGQALQSPPPPSEEPHVAAAAAPIGQLSGWQAQSVLCAWGQAGRAGQLDLTRITDDDDDKDDNGGADNKDGSGDNSGRDESSDESDDDAAANRPFDAHAPNMPGAFHVFTSVADGHASKLFGAHCVRECRGSLQLWQCGAKSGPCRDSDAWEAPDGLFFRTVRGENTTPSAQQQVVHTTAPPGLPKSTPPFHVVPMHHGSCMGRALSVAQAFRTNHPKCRSCGTAPSRPAMPLVHGSAGQSRSDRGSSNATSESVDSDRSQAAGAGENNSDEIASDEETSVEAARGVSFTGAAAAAATAATLPTEGGGVAADWAWADLDDRRVRYQAWRKLAVARAAASTAAAAQAGAHGDRSSGRVVLLEIGAFHACAHGRAASEFETKEGAENGGGSEKATMARACPTKVKSKPSAHAPWVTVRRESEAFLRDVVAHRPHSALAGHEGNGASSSSSSSSNDNNSVVQEQVGVTLVRINEAYPLLDRQDKELEDDQRVRVVSIMQPVLKALRAIDDALVALEKSEADNKRSAQ